MRIDRLVAGCVVAFVLLWPAPPAGAEPIFHVTMQGDLRGFESTTLDPGGPITFSFDIRPLLLPDEDGGQFRFEILRWTLPLSYTDEMRTVYWNEAMSPYPGSLTGRWDPVRGSSMVQTEMVHVGPGIAIDRTLYSGEPWMHVPPVALDPYFHLIPTTLNTWENATGPWGPANYFGTATITNIEPVPEPATLGLLLAGLACARLRRRRKTS